jgi:hypothetical protein
MIGFPDILPKARGCRGGPPTPEAAGSGAERDPIRWTSFHKDATSGPTADHLTVVAEHAVADLDHANRAVRRA